MTSYSLVKVKGDKHQPLEAGLSDVIKIDPKTNDVVISTEFATEAWNEIAIMASTISSQVGYLTVKFRVKPIPKSDPVYLEEMINQAPVFLTETF